MKRFLIATSMLLSLTAMAAGQQDTTVVYQNKRIVIEDDSLETRVSIFSKEDGSEYQKSREVTFVDHQEVERVFVSSPFLPRQVGRRVSLFPTFWGGLSFMRNKMIAGEGGKCTEGLHTAGTSYEWGLSFLDLQSSTFADGSIFATVGLQMATVRFAFQDGYLLSSDADRRMVFDPVAPGGQYAEHNTLTYSALRLPVMLCMGYESDGALPYLDGVQVGVGLSAEWRGRGNYEFLPEHSGDPVSRKLKLNHWGLNLEMSLAYGPLKLGFCSSLTPIFKTADGTKAYTNSINLGVNLGELFSKKR